jgi:hypothetical protein
MKIQQLISRTILLNSVFILALFSSFTPKVVNQEIDTQEKLMSKEAPMKKRQLRHVVLFKFKESATAEDIAKIEKAFSALQDKIPQIKSYEWGTNNSPEGLDKGFTHCFFLTFNSEEDRAIYLPHPDHKAFGGLLGPYLEDVLVLDYWTE